MALEVRDVCVNFGGLRALTDVSLSVESGSVTGLIGPNGAGKTTLFDVITGMRKPSQGTVTFDGRDLRGISPYRRSRLGVGRTFQRLELFGTLTVRDNVRVAASIGRRSRRGSSSATESVDDTTERLLQAMHLEQVAGRRADTLPTGTGRLVELARALAVRPTALLLDEPASGQNAEETTRFASVLRSLTSEGLAVLLVEHDMDLVMSVSDVVFVLVEGAVLCSGTPQEIQRDAAVAQAYLGSFVQDDHG
ncbi:MAG TPA: ABC transporter ATP-binding protein [Acidimicrobiales bacterium]|jgi:branched-chain amino acid transport system ATP-binding protein|nr:ABC transporter ATP-binding protein [Acidimicrobiales bacterium]